MKENIPPEERLLKLIRGEKRSKPRNISPLAADKAGSIALAKPCSCIYLRKAGIIVLALSLAYLLFVFIYPYFGLKKIVLPEIPRGADRGQQAQPIRGVKPLQSYLQGISSRSIFGNAVGTGEVVSVSNVNVDSIKDIKLVGIISGEKIQAVIEDTKLNKSYTVTKGQNIGEMQIEDITEGKVIIRYQGKLFQFSL